MSLTRPLRGSCACKRNQYIIQAPDDTTEVAQVVFGAGASHRLAQASLFSAHLRVPLAWFFSATVAQFPDETASTIRRVYESPFEKHTRRQFCGYCGTPLTYWTEQPRSEAEYIHVTLGSLYRDDLGDLDEMGLIPDTPSAGSVVEGDNLELPVRGGQEAIQEAEERVETSATPSYNSQLIGRESLSIPWVESLMEGSRLGGRLKRASFSRRTAGGSVRVQWEIVEYSDSDGSGSPGNNGKRKLGDREDDDSMEGVTQL